MNKDFKFYLGYEAYSFFLYFIQDRIERCFQIFFYNLNFIILFLNLIIYLFNYINER